MLKHAGFFGWLIVLFVWLVPGLALANDLKIHDVDPPKEGDPAARAKVSVYFELRQGNEAVTGINASDCTVVIDDKTPEVVSAEIKEFVHGDRGVAILFIFPIAKNYSEDSYGIRRLLLTLVQRIDRPIDMLNALPYDVGAKAVGWTRASERSLARSLDEMATTDVVEPNLFSAFGPAIAVMESVQNVSQKYVVLISDVEGAVAGDTDRAGRLINQFVEGLTKNNIRPIIIAYSPDGKETMPNVHLIKRIATNMNAPYFEAHDEARFTQFITQDVYNYIFKQHIYEATLNMDGSNYLPAGKYPFQLTVKLANTDEKAATKISWPRLKKNRTTLWVIISVAGVLIIGVVLFIVLRRRDDDEEIVDEGPQEVFCATCGKPIPKQLYGFKGEFCLSGGLPDCPYYQMPDRGKIQITRGVLADTTFFIKKDMTTIGSYPDNDIFLSDKSVSRKHAAIKTDEGKRYEIRDFGSANGLYINGEKIERKFLRDGDLIRFGAIETVFKLK